MIVEGRKTGKRQSICATGHLGNILDFAAVVKSPIVVDSMGHDSFLEES